MKDSRSKFCSALMLEQEDSLFSHAGVFQDVHVD